MGSRLLFLYRTILLAALKVFCFACRLNITLIKKSFSILGYSFCFFGGSVSLKKRYPTIPAAKDAMIMAIFELSIMVS